MKRNDHIKLHAMNVQYINSDNFLSIFAYFVSFFKSDDELVTHTRPFEFIHFLCKQVTVDQSLFDALILDFKI